MSKDPQEHLRQLFDATMDAHQGILIQVARTYCPLEADRKDLVQEMMLQVWHALPKYNPQFKITTWMYRIALNVAISQYRKARHRPPTELPSAALSAPSAEAEGAGPEQQLRLLEQFISELNDLDKALILLYLEEKSHAEIAEITGLSLSNVSTRVSRIKDKLKKRFALQTT
jgi:RNA polymerase sigma-70 factor (ECF subfamily)